MHMLRILLIVVLVFMFVCHIAEGKRSKYRKYKLRSFRLKRQKTLRYMKRYYRLKGFGENLDEPLEHDFREATMRLQSVAGLRMTGRIDEPTARALSWPRCGNRDTLTVGVTEEGERKRRYVLSGPTFKWEITDLTYKIQNYPDMSISTITEYEVDEAVATAFKLWSDVTPLTFTRVPPTTEADIVLLFGKTVHTNVVGDTSFDGPGGTVAHSFTPNSGWGSLNGDLHFDDDETFTHKKYYGSNLFYVTAHELGHSLGLAHSTVEGSLMWPYIRSYIPNYQLPEDDVQGIQAIYGPNPNPPASEPEIVTQPPATTLTPAPAYCNISFDDVAIIRGELFAFHGKRFWRFSTDGHLISSEDGDVIRAMFKNVPSVVHAIVERWYDEKILFVKGQKIWTIEGPNLDRVSSRYLSELGLPKMLDCSMHRASDGITYYFKGKDVYKYDEFDEVMTEDSPMRTHKAFMGIPRATRVTAAFTGRDGYHNLLVGTEYYRVDPDLNSDGTLSNFGQDFLRCPRVQ